MTFKFCPECAAPTEPGARFCGACGQPFAGSTSTSAAPIAGIFALVTLLILGGGFWFYFRLAPEQPRPLKPGEAPPGAPAANVAAGAPQAQAGQAHPPMELPDDIKAYIAGLAQKAKDNPKDTEAWQTLARVYYRASRLDPSYTAQAQEAFEHLLEIDAKSLEGLRGLGNLAYDKQDRPKAIEYYEKYLTLAPDDPEVRTDLGTMYFEAGDPDRSVLEYQRALEKNPKFYQAHFNLAVVYDSRGDRAAAHGELEKARDLADDPNVKERITTLLAAAKSSGGSLADAAAAAASAGGPPGVAPAGMPGGAPAAPAKPATTFPESVEQVFRTHPVAGPKVVAVEWPEAGKGRILMREFPMDQMPDSMKTSYLDKMATAVRESQTRFSQPGPVTIELVDQASGKVMATVTP